MEFIQIILLVFIAWFIVTQKSETMARLFGRQHKIILDSCALIDGRIVEIVSSGFVKDDLIIPQFILNELQLLADGSDSHKRERARFGLDIAHQLQDTAANKVIIDRTLFPQVNATDDKLVLLAKKLSAQLYTTDYNLGKVAAVEGIKVLNVNELAGSLRPITLPGESLNIKIVQKGSGRDQGVGYLEDGTMIVVDNAVKYVGKLVPITVTRMHQTMAGKMVFGQVRLERKVNSSVDPRPQSTAAVQQTSNTRTASGRSSKVEKSNNKLHGRLSQTLRRRNSIQ